MSTLYSGGLVFDGKGNLQENQGVLVDDQKISKVAPCENLRALVARR